MKNNENVFSFNFYSDDSFKESWAEVAEGLGNSNFNANIWQKDLVVRTSTLDLYFIFGFIFISFDKKSVLT